jgi:hypothetical protein
MEGLYRIYSKHIFNILKDQITDPFQGQTLEESSLHSINSLETLLSFHKCKNSLANVKSFEKDSTSKFTTPTKLLDSSENSQRLDHTKNNPN